MPRAPGGYGDTNRHYPTPQNSDRRGPAYSNRAPAQNYARQPEPSRQPTRPDAYSYRGAQQPAYGYTHPAQPGQNYQHPAPQTYAYRPQTYPNRPQTYSNPGYANRPQTYSNPSYGYGYTNRPTPQNYAARPGYAYSNGYSNRYSNSYPSNRAPQPYRAPQTDPRAYSSHSYEPRGNTMARNESGGFRGFSREKEPKYSAPKYKAPKNFGGGGHFSAPKSPKMSHSSGGGRHHFL